MPHMYYFFKSGGLKVKNKTDINSTYYHLFITTRSLNDLLETIERWKKLNFMREYCYEGIKFFTEKALKHLKSARLKEIERREGTGSWKEFCEKSNKDHKERRRSRSEKGI